MEYKDTKLIVFLKTFSKEELNEFDKFLSGNFFRQGRDPLLLLKSLKKHHPDFDGDKFCEENIFTDLFPGSDYSDKKSQNIFRSVSSYLFKAVEEFLFISGVKNNSVIKNRIILESLMNRNLLKYYEQYMKKAETDLISQENITGNNDLERLMQGSLNSRYFAMKLDMNSYLQNNFDGMEIISVYFWINLLRNAKIKYFNDMYNGIITENKSVERFIEAVDLEKILENHTGSSRYVELFFNYYTYMSMINNIDIEYYGKAKKIFFDNKSLISRADKNYYYSDLINIGIVNSFDGKNIKAYNSLIKSCLEDKAYKISDEDFMQPDFYRNAVLSETRLNNFEWAEKFIEEYTDELKPEYRDNLKYYSQAMISYTKCDYEAALEFISKVKYDLAIFKLDVKIIMLKIFFKLDMTDQFYSLADTFKHYIQNSKNLSVNNKRMYLNYIKYFLKILKLKSSYKKNDAEFLREHINKEKIIYDRKWLIKSIDDL